MGSRIKLSNFYADAIRENPSGMSDADKTTHAASNFAAVQNHNFAYMHCWNIMKDEPKWQEARTISFAQSARGDADGIINLGDDNGSQAAQDKKRPTGRDSSKAPKKKANSDAGSTSSAEYASCMQDLSLQKIAFMQEESARKTDRWQQLSSIDEKHFDEMQRHNKSMEECEQEKIRMMRDKHERERQKEKMQEDERILGIDLDACTPALRMYYEALQQDIMEKMAARRRKGQGP